MEIHQVSGQDERLILTSMIVSNEVLGCIQSNWKGNEFSSQWSNLIGKWCCKYYRKYGKAPGRKIESLFNHWSSKSRNEKTVHLVADFLDGLSQDYVALKKEVNTDYVLDVAQRHFRKLGIERLQEEVENLLIDDNVLEASARIRSFTEIEIGPSKDIDIPTDKERMMKSFEQRRDPLIKYPGALGNFFGDHLEREGFIALMGPEKRGKTWWLIDMAMRALLQRRKVAFFEAGDMGENQILRRFLCRIAKHPIYPKDIKIPTKIRVTDQGLRVYANRVSYKKGLSKKLSWKSCMKLMEDRIKSKNPYLKLSCYPNSTLTTTTIMSKIQDWSREDWVPDVIIIDYADIMNMDIYNREGRDRIDALWRQLRRISQEFHCLLITATQTNRESYSATTLGRQHASEDKRKLAHVTGAVGLNATEDESKKGVMRLNWMVLREGEFRPGRCVYVAGCLHIGNPAIKSCFRQSKKKKKR